MTFRSPSHFAGAVMPVDGKKSFRADVHHAMQLHGLATTSDWLQSSAHFLLSWLTSEATYRHVQITDGALAKTSIPTWLAADNTTIFSVCPQNQITASTFSTKSLGSLKNINVGGLIAAEKHNKLQFQLKQVEQTQALRIRRAK